MQGAHCNSIAHFQVLDMLPENPLIIKTFLLYCNVKPQSYVQEKQSKLSMMFWSLLQNLSVPYWSGMLFILVNWNHHLLVQDVYHRMNRTFCSFFLFFINEFQSLIKAKINQKLIKTENKSIRNPQHKWNATGKK